MQRCLTVVYAGDVHCAVLTLMFVNWQRHVYHSFIIYTVSQKSCANFVFAITLSTVILSVLRWRIMYAKITKKAFYYTWMGCHCAWKTDSTEYHQYRPICLHLWNCPVLHHACRIVPYVHGELACEYRKGQTLTSCCGIIIIIVWFVRCWTLPFLRSCSCRLDDSALDDRQLPDQCWVVLSWAMTRSARSAVPVPRKRGHTYPKGSTMAHRCMYCHVQCDRRIQGGCVTDDVCMNAYGMTWSVRRLTYSLKCGFSRKCEYVTTGQTHPSDSSWVNCSVIGECFCCTEYNHAEW